MAIDLPELKTKITADTSGFGEQMKKVDRNITLNINSFRVASSAAKAFGSASDELKSKQQFLSAQVKDQADKVRLLEAEYRKSVESKGKDSKATQELADKWAKAQAALNKSQGELKQTNTELTKSVGPLGTSKKAWDNFSKSVTGAGKSLAGTAANIGKIAMTGVGLLAGAAVAGGAAVGALAVKTAEYGSNLQDTSMKTGIGVERLQELQYIGQQTGVELGSMTKGMAKITDAMGAAKSPTSEQAKVFKKLGVSTKDAKGNLKDSQSVFLQTIDALGAVKNETERNIMAQKLFGKSYEDINPLIKTGGKNLEAMAKWARESGAIMSEDDVTAAADFGDTLDALGFVMNGVGMQVGALFLPALSEIGMKGAQYLSEFGKAIKSSGGDMGKLSENIGKVAGNIVKDLAANAPQFIEAGLSILGGIVQGITNSLPELQDAGTKILEIILKSAQTALPGLITWAQGIVAAVLTGVQQNIGKASDAAKAILGGLQTSAEAALAGLTTWAQGIVVAVLTGVQQNIGKASDAAKAIVGGIQTSAEAALAGLTTWAQGIVVAVLTGVQQNIGKASDTAKAIMDGILTGAQTGLAGLITWSKEIVTGVLTGVQQNIGKASEAAKAILNAIVLIGSAQLENVITFAKEIVVSIFTGVNKNLSKVGDAAKEIVNKLVDTLGGLSQQLVDAGIQMIAGLWKGIEQKFGEVLKGFKDLINQIPEGVRKLLGISSPSKVFAEIGTNMAAGLGVGFADEMKSIERRLVNTTRSLTAGTRGATMATVGAGATNNTYNNYAPTYNLNGSQGRNSMQWKRY